MVVLGIPPKYAYICETRIKPKRVISKSSSMKCQQTKGDY